MNIFGREYDEVGSSDKGLLLRNSGKVKVLFGNSFIDLINDNGAISNTQNTISEVSSESEMIQDGFYYVNDTLIAKIGNKTLKLATK